MQAPPCEMKVRLRDVYCAVPRTLFDAALPRLLGIVKDIYENLVEIGIIVPPLTLEIRPFTASISLLP